MKKKHDLSAYADHKIMLMAVDSEGDIIQKGNRGLFRDLDYFWRKSWKTVLFFDSMTDNRSEMVFLNQSALSQYTFRMEKRTFFILNCPDMEQLNPYFDCEAITETMVYVLDDNGFKLFNSTVELIMDIMYFLFCRRWNIFTILLTKQRRSWKKKAVVIQCGVDGTEYFYGLKEWKMPNGLIFLVPAECCYDNVKLVNFVMVFIVSFTVIAAVWVILGESFVMRRNQQEAIRVERENNEAGNREYRAAAGKPGEKEAFQVAQEANRSKSSFPCQYVTWSVFYARNHWYDVTAQIWCRR